MDIEEDITITTNPIMSTKERLYEITTNIDHREEQSKMSKERISLTKSLSQVR